MPGDSSTLQSMPTPMEAVVHSQGYPCSRQGYLAARRVAARDALIVTFVEAQKSLLVPPPIGDHSLGSTSQLLVHSL